MNYDVTIIGAGIMGLCTAYQLARRANLKILVLEKGKSLGEGSTGASSAVCRHRYSLTPMIELARDGINVYKNWESFTGLDNPHARFHQDGVIWYHEGGNKWATQEVHRLEQLGVKSEVIYQDDVRARFPALNPSLTAPSLADDDSGGYESSDEGFLFEIEAGYFEPVDAMLDLAAAAKREGVEIQMGQEVAAIETSDGKTIGVRLVNGDTVSSEIVINASGPWCNTLLEPMGLAEVWPLKPTRIQIVHINKPKEVPGKIPVVCDLLGGIYFREQNRGQQIVIGSTLEEDEREVVDPSDYKNWVDDDFKAAKLFALKHRIPSLPDHLQISGYTGLYTVNQSDVHPVVSETEISGLYVCNGFSGHGFKAAPAIGSLLAQMITGKSIDFDTTASLDFLRFDRAPLSVDVMNVMA